MNLTGGQNKTYENLKLLKRAHSVLRHSAVKLQYNGGYGCIRCGYLLNLSKYTHT